VRTPAKVKVSDLVPRTEKTVHIPTVIFDMMDSLPEELLDSYGEEMNCADVELQRGFGCKTAGEI